MTVPALPPLLRSALLAGVPGVVHGFTTRRSAAGGPADLSLVPAADEAPEALEARWARVRALLGQPGAPVRVASQVHGCVVLDGDDAPAAPVGDGWVATRPGVLLAVRVADCVPVLLAVDDGRAVSVVHAGWRGTALDVVGGAVATLCRRAGCSPGRVVAAVGPCIGVDAYQVGEEVVQGVRGAGVPEEVFVRRDRGARPHVDLAEANRWQLHRAGVGAVDVLGLCTASHAGSLWSHRREGPAAGRQAGVIGRCG